PQLVRVPHVVAAPSGGQTKPLLLLPLRFRPFAILVARRPLQFCRHAECDLAGPLDRPPVACRGVAFARGTLRLGLGTPRRLRWRHRRLAFLPPLGVMKVHRLPRRKAERLWRSIEVRPQDGLGLRAQCRGVLPFWSRASRSALFRISTGMTWGCPP